MKLLMDLLMKLLIKSDWRGIFMVYLIDFQQKHISPGDYPTSSAILDKNPLFSTGSFVFYKTFKNLLFIKLLIKRSPPVFFGGFNPIRGRSNLAPV